MLKHSQLSVILNKVPLVKLVKSKLIFKAIIFLIFAQLLACAPKYVKPNNSSAFLTCKMSDALRATTSNQNYFILSTESCSALPGYGLASNMTTLWGEPEEIVPLETGKRIYIRAVNAVHSKSGNGVISTHCQNFVSFIPEKETNYSIQQIGNNPKCRVILINNANGKAPDTFQVHKLPADCTF